MDVAVLDVVIGVDVHKHNHTFVAVDQAGKKLGTKFVPATTAGHKAALHWARKGFPGNRRWGVEDVRSFSGRLEADLLAAGEAVVRVAPKLTARHRASARTYGKSDPIDGLAIARAVLREPDLPVARHDPATREIRLLVDRRDDLLMFRTATTNRLLEKLHELDPSRPLARAALNYVKHRRAVTEQLHAQSGLLAELARDELADVANLTKKINALTRKIESAIELVAPTVLTIPGCGPLTAAKIIGETADVTRFASEAKFARYVGVAPIPQWSGGSDGRVRLSRSGNRQLNTALHTIALSQIRRTGRGEVYYRRRVAEGNSHGQAMRSLKRQLCRVVYGALRADHRREPATAD